MPSGATPGFGERLLERPGRAGAAGREVDPEELVGRLRPVLASEEVEVAAGRERLHRRERRRQRADHDELATDRAAEHPRAPDPADDDERRTDDRSRGLVAAGRERAERRRAAAGPSEAAPRGPSAGAAGVTGGVVVGGAVVATVAEGATDRPITIPAAVITPSRPIRRIDAEELAATGSLLLRQPSGPAATLGVRLTAGQGASGAGGGAPSGSSTDGIRSTPRPSGAGSSGIDGRYPHGRTARAN